MNLAFQPFIFPGVLTGDDPLSTPRNFLGHFRLNSQKNVSNVGQTSFTLSQACGCDSKFGVIKLVVLKFNKSFSNGLFCLCLVCLNCHSHSNIMDTCMIYTYIVFSSCMFTNIVASHFFQRTHFQNRLLRRSILISFLETLEHFKSFFCWDSQYNWV